MMLTVADKTVSTVGIVDDDPSARQGFGWTLQDANVDAVEENGPLGQLNEFVTRASRRFDAVLCDHHLKIRNYSTFDGAQLAAALNQAHIPTVLCTRWEDAHLDLIRPYRDRVPALIQWEDLDPDAFVDALALTIRELNGEFTSQRRPWRTQVHIADVGVDEQHEFFFVDLPGWISDKVIRLRKVDLGEGLAAQLRVDARWHARVNIGAEDSWELYFRDWEPK
jgi:hypothetical protein